MHPNIKIKQNDYSFSHIVRCVETLKLIFKTNFYISSHNTIALITQNDTFKKQKEMKNKKHTTKLSAHSSENRRGLQKAIQPTTEYALINHQEEVGAPQILHA
jgi:hypothetical protein